MAPVFAAVGAGLLAGVVVVLLVRRWPQTAMAAPRVDPATIRREVGRHRRLAQTLRPRVDPETATGLALTVAGLVVIAGGAAVGVLLLMVRRNRGFARWDLSAARWAATHATDASTSVLRVISMLGGTMVIVIAVVLTLVFEQRRLRSRAVVLFLLVAVIGQNVLANGIKVLVDRARPDLSQLTGFASSSFPSGHATAAAATYAAIALVVSRRRGPSVRAMLAGGAAAIAVAVAGTRVMLGVHWVTDVMAGLALGWAWFALCSIAFGGRFMRFGSPVVVAEEAAEASRATPV